MDEEEIVDVNRMKEINNPFIREILTNIRDKETGEIEFRKGLVKIGRYMGYEITKSMDYEEKMVETPVDWANGIEMTDRDNVVLISVLRAAIPYVEGLVKVFEKARMGIISASRGPAPDFDVEIQYAKLPNITPKDTVIIADPMLATGSTLSKVLEFVNNSGNPKRKIITCVNSADKGLNELLKMDSDIEVYTAAHDKKLNDHGYIVPGLGDAGDRAFGTQVNE